MIGLYISFTITADEALTNVSAVDINAAHKAAIIKPNTPGLETRLVITTKTSLGAISRGKILGFVFDITLPIHPAFETTIAEIGSIIKTLKAAAFLPSLTFFAAINLIIKP